MSKYIRVNGRLYKAVDALGDDNYIKTVKAKQALEKQFKSKFIDRILLQREPSKADIEIAKKWAKSAESFLAKNSRIIKEDKIDVWDLEHESKEIGRKFIK